MKTAALLIFIPFEGLLHAMGLPLQSFSLIIFFAISSLFKWLEKVKITKISSYLIYLITYLVAVSIINLYINIELFYSFLRQLSSLLFGITLFFFFRYIIMNTSEKILVRYMMLGYYIVTVFSIFDIVQNNFRVQSLFSEPSHLGQYLVFLILPSLVLFKKHFSRWEYLIIFSLLMLQLMLTYSTTAMIKIILIIIGVLFFTKKITFLSKLMMFAITLLLLFSLFYYINYINDNNYMSMMLNATMSALEGGRIPLSILDRASFWVILYYIQPSIHMFFGYGIGGDAINYMNIFPENIAMQIMTVKQFGFTINSFFGKLLVYGGIFAILLYFVVFYKAYKALSKQPQYEFLKAVLFAIFCYETMGMGVYTMVEIWFWLAFIDAKNIVYNRDTYV